MKRKLIVLGLLLATTFFWLPAGSSNMVAAQNRGGRMQGNQRGDRGMTRGRERGRWNQGRNWNRGQWTSHRYRNYGQYRRTQVGNRRFRTEKRYYRRNGVRVSRSVRIFY